MAISLGDISFGLGPDETRLKSGMDALLKLGNAVETMAAKSGKAAKQIAADLMAQEKATISAFQQTVKLSDKIRTAGGDPSLVNEVASAYNNLAKTMATANKAASDLTFQRSQEAFQVTLTRVQRELGGVITGLRQQASEQAKVTAETRASEQATLRYERALASVQAKAAATEQQLSRLGAGSRAQIATDPNDIVKRFQAAYASPDTSRLAAFRATSGANTDLRDLQLQAKNLAATEKDVASALSQANADILRQENYLFRAQNAVARYNQMLSQLSPNIRQTLAQDFNPVTAKNQLEAALKNPNIDRLGMQQAMQQFQSSIRNATQDAKHLAESGLVGFFQQLSQNAVLVMGPLSGIGFRLTLLSNMIESIGFKSAGAIAGVGLLGLTFKEVATHVIDVAEKMQRAELTMEAVSGTSKTVGSDLTFIKDVAQRAGANFFVLADSFGKLQAASKGTSLEGDKTRKIFEELTLVNSKLGRSSQDLEGVLLAVEQIMSKGQVMAQELHLQLGNRMPGAMQAFAEGLGVSTAKLNQMMQAGELTVSVLEKFADAAAKRYNINIGDTINTITAAHERLTNSITFFFDRVDKATGISATYVAILNSMRTAVDGLTHNMQGIVQVSVAVGGAFAALALPTLIGWFVSAAIGVTRLTMAMIGLNAAVAANPIGMTVNVLARLGMLLIGAVAGYEIYNNALTENAKKQGDALKNAEDYLDLQDNAIKFQHKQTMDRISDLAAEERAINKRIDKQKELIANLRNPAPIVDSFSGTVTEAPIDPVAIQEAEQLLLKFQNDADNTARVLTELWKKAGQQLKDIANQKDSPELTRQQLTGLAEAGQKIQNIQEKITAIQVPPGLGRDMAKNIADVDNATAELQIHLNNLHLPPDLKVLGQSLVDQFKAMDTKLKEMEIFEKQRKSAEEFKDKLKDVNREIELMGMMPGQREFAMAFAKIDEEVVKMEKHLREVGDHSPEAAKQMASDWGNTARVLENMKIREKLAVPMEEAALKIKMMKAELAGVFLPPAMKELYTTQLQINQQTQEFYLGLVKAGVGLQAAKTAADEFGSSLAKLKNAELQLKNFPSLFSSLGDVFSRGLDTAVDQFVEGIKNGTDMATVFRNIWISVLGDIMKEMIKLAITNPLKNLLFGQNAPVIGPVSYGGQGAGSLLGPLFGAGGGAIRNPYNYNNAGGLTAPNVSVAPNGSQVFGGQSTGGPFSTGQYYTPPTLSGGTGAGTNYPAADTFGGNPNLNISSPNVLPGNTGGISSGGYGSEYYPPASITSAGPSPSFDYRFGNWGYNGSGGGVNSFANPSQGQLPTVPSTPQFSPDAFSFKAPDFSAVEQSYSQSINQVTQNTTQAVGSMTTDISSTVTSQFEAARNSIRQIESGSFQGNYGLQPNSDGAFGAYQITPGLLKDKSNDVFGRQVGTQEMLQNPGMQDQFFDKTFGGYVNKYGYDGAAQAWFAGPGGVGKLGRTDSLGTSVGGYTNQFRNNMNSPYNPANGGGVGGSGAGIDPSMTEFDDAAKKATKDLTDFGDKGIKDASAGLDKVQDASKSATDGLKSTEQSATQMAGSAETAGTQMTAAGAGASTLGTSSTAAGAEMQTAGASAETAGAEFQQAGATAGASGGGGLFGGLGGLFAAKGLASYGKITRFAMGGIPAAGIDGGGGSDIVHTPHFFSMGGGSTGQMGEAGPEAIMPLVRDGAGRLGVHVHSGDSSGSSDDVIAAIKDLHQTLTTKSMATKVVNAFDGPGFLNEALSSRAGETALLNFVRSRSTAFKQALR